MLFYPPVILLLFALAMFALDRWVPIAELVPVSLRPIGFLILAAGVAFIVYCRALFIRHHTPIKPFETSNTLILVGPYRYTRNPIYLTMILSLLGLAWAFGSLSPFALVPLFAWVLTSRFIVREEAMLRARFGEQYDAYCRTVGRWWGRRTPSPRHD